MVLQVVTSEGEWQWALCAETKGGTEILVVQSYCGSYKALGAMEKMSSQLGSEQVPSCIGPV